MNNKRLGTEFEREVCDILNRAGWWVHFMSPDARGAQPFDIIAVKHRCAVAIDCKTSASKIFKIDRLEDNQIMAFDKWITCGNVPPVVFVKHAGKIRLVPYGVLKMLKKIDLSKTDEYSDDTLWGWYV